ncbi:MAG: hypothetical protein P8X74_02780 [Reinekea sp.]
MLPENFNEPMGAPAIFEKQIEIKLLPPASTLESRIQARISCHARVQDTTLASPTDPVQRPQRCFRCFIFAGVVFQTDTAQKLSAVQCEVFFSSL